MEQINLINSIIKNKVLPELEKSFSENLASVLVYGSVARNSYNSKYSDINLLILLKENNPSSVINFGKSASSLIRKHKLTPLLMTETEFISSADVFPMEYNDIKDSYILVKGEDPVPKLELTDTNLRHQSESSLRGIINQIRQFIIASRGKKKFAAVMIKKMSGSIESVFRGSLRLKKSDITGLNRKEIILKTAEVYSLNAEEGLKLLSPDEGDIYEKISSILLFLSGLADKIDKMDI